MYKYFCVENGQLISVLEYEPQVPQTVSVVPVGIEHAALMESGTHYFDSAHMRVVPYPKGQQRDFDAEQSNQMVSHTPVCIPINSGNTPDWAKGELFFSYASSPDKSGVLSVINNTGFTVTASASTNVGGFTETVIQSGQRYDHECKFSDTPMGFLMFRATSTKKRVSK
jgi:hypothetical protein